MCALSLLVSCSKAEPSVSSSGKPSEAPKSVPQESVFSQESESSKPDTPQNPVSSSVPKPSVNSEQPKPPQNASEPEEVEVSNIKVVKKHNPKLFFSSANFSYENFNDAQSGKSMPYRLHIPERYDAKKSYPVILFLHGAGEIGSDNESHLGHFSQSFNVASDILEESLIVCPQTPEGWSMDSQYGDQNGYLGVAKRILDGVIAKYNGNRDRVYLTGLSLGSFATWRMLETFPGFFAASVPVCGGNGSYASPVMISTPIWLFHGTADDIVSHSSSSNTYNAIKDAGGQLVKFTSLPGVGHEAWDYAYVDREMFSWMFAQNRTVKQNVAYTTASLFEITGHDGKQIVTEKDIMNVWYIADETADYIEIYFNYDATELLKKKYNANKNEQFTVRYCGQKLYDFKLTGFSSDIFRIEKTVDDKSFKGLYYSLKNFE